MAQQISDLVINLDVDSATFSEQVARIKGQLTGMADDSEKVQTRMQRASERQVAALKSVGDAGASAAAEIKSRQADATEGLAQNWQKVSKSVDETHRRVTDLSQRMRENDGQAAVLARRQDELAASFFRQIDSVRQLNGETQSLANVQARFRAARAQGNITQQDYLALISHTTARQKELQIVEEKAGIARARFLRQLKSQVVEQKLSGTELLRMKAAQVGASDAAEVYIRKLEAAKVATHGLGLQSAAARRELGVLMGEVMRGNFGALRGSGITLANRAGWIDQLMTLRGLGMAGMVGGIAAAVVGLGKAWYDGSKESEEFNKQLILTGNYAGKTSGQLQALARSLAGNGITQHAAAGVLAQVVGSGAFSGNDVSMVSNVAARLQQATGQAVDETINQFKRLKDDPVNAVATLNDSLHFLTATQYEQISSAQALGDSQKAAELAMRAYSDAVIQRAGAVEDNLGSLEKAWNWVKNAASGAWDAMLGVGRNPDTAMKRQDSFAEWQAAEKEYRALSSNLKVDPDYAGNNVLQKADAERLRNARQQVELKKQAYDLADQQYAQEGLTAAREKMRTDQQTQAIRSQQQFNQLVESGATAAEKRASAEKKLSQLIEKNRQDAKDGIATLWTDKDIAAARAGIEKQFKDAKTPKGKSYSTPAGDKAEEKAQAELLTLQAQLKTLEQHTSVNDVISKQRQDLWQTENQFTVLQEAAGRRQLTAQEKSLLAHKEETLEYKRQLADLGDKVASQQKLNQLADQAVKFEQQQKAARAGIKAQSEGVSSRDAGRATTLERLRESYAHNPQAQQKILEEQRATFKDEDALRANWLAGAKQGWAEYADSAADAYGSMKSAASATFDGISQNMADMLTTGKANWADFTRSTLSMLTQILMKQAMAGLVSSATSSLGFAGGGYTGSGGKYEPAGVVHRGEFVFTQEATNRIGVGNLYRMMRGYATGGLVGVSGGGVASPFGVSVYAPVSVTTGQGDSGQQKGSGDALGKAYQQVINSSIREGITREVRPGGIIWNATKQR
ncbi:phage tail tape measure protein [Citrobacter freundii]|uniref:phage tail tape measure protein n=1 Tax=Citrobacter freundii TaxID=546 RepID=UPI00155E3489|nr:phage tail tape measure protein [Citrobacter freundii]NGF66031.1 phage tail tape measure protein [Citrobacter freundii]HBV7994874.1 phage tail tape measure protein [Citrobacter freundii]HCB2575602.1 phage tail tape measure protein [Citrobacter freundii]